MAGAATSSKATGRAVGGKTSGGSTIAPVAPMLGSAWSAHGHRRGKIVISLLSAFAIVFPLPAEEPVFWLIFVTLMLPVEVRIGPTYAVVSNLNMLNSYAGLTVPLVAPATATFLFRQFFLTVPDELVEAANGRRRPHALSSRRAAAAVAHQHCGPVCHPVHLRLEPVPLATAGHHQRGHVPGGAGHQARNFR